MNTEKTDVRFWPKADMHCRTAHVRFRGKSRHDVLRLSCPLMTQSGHWLCSYPTPFQSGRFNSGIIFVFACAGPPLRQQVTNALAAEALPQQEKVQTRY
jgi:hypothetical protein